MVNPITLTTLLLMSVFSGSALADRHEPGLGAAIYTRSCIACHGADGAGAMPGVPDFTSPGGPLGKTDSALLDSILNGTAAGSTTVVMPARGGDDNLTEQQARMLLTYIRREFGK